MPQATVPLESLLEVTPGYRQGRPCLAGTGMTVHTVAALYANGYRAEDIVEQFPHVDLSRVYAAIAYYLVNREQVDAELAQDRDWGEDMAKTFPDGWRGEPADDA